MDVCDLVMKGEGKVNESVWIVNGTGIGSKWIWVVYLNSLLSLIFNLK
jgi:hypothetical protein